MTDIDRLSLARDLVVALEQGDEAKAQALLDEVAGIRETQLYREVGRLTRQLHDAMASFSVDTRIAELTRNDIPDAKERLHHVMTMTEQSANQTLTVIEELIPVAQGLARQAVKLAGNWERFMIREMPYEEFKGMAQDITRHFNDSKQALTTIQNGLNDILMAQGFQDITGQIIRRVIALVGDLEAGLVELIRLSGTKAASAKPSQSPELPGPVVPGIDDKAGDVATSQDDVDDLLSSLGF
ncbi:MAG: protein phosphatase CheZ [Gammaproteobacteria bacterium]